MKAKALVDTLGDKIADQVQHSGKVKAEVLVIKVDSRIAVLRVKAHEDRLTKV